MTLQFFHSGLIITTEWKSDHHCWFLCENVKGGSHEVRDDNLELALPHTFRDKLSQNLPPMNMLSLNRPTKTPVQFDFIIREWSTVLNGDGASLVSPDSLAGWLLEVLPRGSNGEMGGQISVRLHHRSEEDVFVSYVVSIVSSKTAELVSPCNLRICSEGPEKFCGISTTTIKKVISTEELTTRPDLVVDDTLIFRVELMIYGERLSTVPLSLFQHQEKANSLNDDIIRLLEADGKSNDDCDFFDIVLSCGSLRIPCHKGILAARSPVFRRKLSASLFGAKMLFSRGVYHVDGMDPEILRELVHYIYSDRCRCMHTV